VWVYFLFRPVVIPGSSSTFLTVNSGGTPVESYRILADGRLQCLSGSTTTVGTVSAGTTYHVWCHYKKGSGANAVIDIAFSTDGLRPTSGNNFAQKTNGTSTSQVDRLIVGPTLNTQTHIFDKVRVDDAQIGDNPP
jgi:hypothetical protein